jgi:hypothetical protein
VRSYTHFRDRGSSWFRAGSAVDKCCGYGYEDTWIRVIVVIVVVVAVGGGSIVGLCLCW